MTTITLHPDPAEAEDYEVLRNNITIPSGSSTVCEGVARVIDDGELETAETLRISIASTYPPWIFSLLGPNTAVNAAICDPEGELWKEESTKGLL